ncbi:MAG TPA: hypothetical protein VGV35_20020 [Bryobacteraceae bacterium]|nr:hypothetical protein [Bryobacteraceae bacterium]
MPSHAGHHYGALRAVLGNQIISEGGKRLRLPARLTLLLLAAVFALCVYRAATQAIVLDEAFTYTYFVKPPFAQMMTTYNTNDHIPNSLLAKATMGLFGMSEFTLRIPTLLCCLVYLFALRAIALAAFSGEWAVVTFALLSLHPLVLDLMSAARGYGPALAFLIAALWFLLRKEWAGSGLCLGLSTAANLAFLCPVGALGAMAALADTAKKTFGRFIDLVCIPAAVIPFVLYIVPLSRANPDQFQFGAPTMAEALESYIELSFMDKWPPFPGLVVPGFEILTVLILAGSAAAWVYLFRKRDGEPVDRLILLNGGALLAGVLATWVAHVTAGAGYPWTRTGVFWPVMITLGGMALLYRFVQWRALRWVALALASLCLIHFVRELRVDYFQEWKYDSGSKRIANVILRDGGKGKVRVVTGPLLQFSLGFYRDMYRADWEIVEDAKATGDYYVFKPEDARAELRVFYKDAVSGVVVQRGK